MCPLAELEVGRGVTVLAHGQALAIFRTSHDAVHAVGNYDPIARASGLAKGIVGVRDGVPFVASTSHRRSFDLTTGRCMDDSSMAVPWHPVRIVDGFVHVGARVDV